MVIRLSGNGWRCWRNGDHSGGHPAHLIQVLIGCSIAVAHDIVAAEGGPLLSLRAEEEIAENLAFPPKKPPKPVRIVCPQWPKSFRAFTEPSAGPYLAYVWKRGIIARAWELTAHYNLYFAVTGTFKGRVIFPVTEQGKLISWTGRSIWPQERQRYKALTTDPEKAQAWQVDPASDAITNHLLWYDELVHAKRRDVLVLVEGPFDALKVCYMGEDVGIHATCLFTSTPSPDQIALLRKLAQRFNTVVIMLDDDARVKATNLWRRLKGIARTRLAYVSEGDPGEIASQQQLRAIIDEAVDI
jgi:hypothetical protein